MIVLTSIKLILRSWWRNKVFSLISLLSLAIGIACSTLLTAFVIYEYNIEIKNPDKERIYYLSQDHPMQTDCKVSYIDATIPQTLKSKYAEVEDYVQFQYIRYSALQVENNKYENFDLIGVTPSFSKFFHYKTIFGNIDEVLTKPGMIAINHEVAKKIFGKENPVGRIITVDNLSHKADKTFKIGAVFQPYNQSILNLTAFTSTNSIDKNDLSGGPTLLLMKGGTDINNFINKIRADKEVPTMLVTTGKYYLSSLRDAYFESYPQESIRYIKRGQKGLLKVAFISAILVLLIACFNYVNLSFSRVIQQLKMISVEKLMGANVRNIRIQLFTDTFLTVFIAFLIALLLMHDLISLFDSIITTDLQTSFLFSTQVFPIILLSICILTVIPTAYASKKLSTMSDSDYRTFYTGKKRKTIISILVISQFIVSICLTIGLITTNKQINLIKNGGEKYENIIELGNSESGDMHVMQIKKELEGINSIVSSSITGGSFLNTWLTSMPIKKEDGTEIPCSYMGFAGELNLFRTLDIKLLKGIDYEKSTEMYEKPVYINQMFCEKYIPIGENPLGKPFKNYDKSADSKGIIAGITEDFFINSLESELSPSMLFFIPPEICNFLLIRMDGKNNKETLAKIKKIWDKYNPDKNFLYIDIHQEFLNRNKKVFELAHLLFMYSLISIFLTCFGLFGISLYATEQRTKEIGIRKVNGASTFQIMFMLNKEFLVWIGIAFTIACPISWYLLNRWLETFVYRTEATILTCLYAGIITLTITLATVSWNSYRAASANPVRSLKSE